MSSFHIRPRFSQTLEMGVEEARRRIIAEVEKGVESCEVKSFPGFICLEIPEAEQHFWSPRLNLSLDDAEDGRTSIVGIYGPNTNVWSMFLYGYLLSGTVAVFSAALGFAQSMVGARAWGWIPFGVMAAMIIGLYLFAQFGQKLGAQQTFRLHRIYEAAIGRTVEIH